MDSSRKRDFMVIRLGKGKVDENLLKLVLELVSDLERRLLKVERQVEALIQEVYGLKYLEVEEGRTAKGEAVVACGEGKGGGEVKEGNVEVDFDTKKSTPRKEVAVIPRVKLAS